MFSLIPREIKFFDLFEKQVNILEDISLLLLKISQADTFDPLWAERSRAIEKEGDVAAAELYKALRDTFTTPFDQEDICKLTDAVDSFLDFIDAAISRISNYRVVGDEAINNFIIS